MLQTLPYSSKPAPDERRIAIAVQDAPTPTSPGTLIQHGGGIDIALYNQPSAARHATYGRGASIAGEITLSTTHGATSVQITLDGKVESTSSRKTRLHAQFLHTSSTLWEEDGSHACPSILPFSFAMPESFVDSETGSTFSLPPSYDSGFAVEDMQVRCVYQLSVLIVRSRWTSSKSMSVDIDYSPRTVPERSILNTPSPSFDSVRLAPDQWCSISAVVPQKMRSTLKAVNCELFVPSVRVFAKDDTIPFFLQLRGTSLSMLALYGSASQSDEGWAHRLLHVAEHVHLAPRTIVTIKRQVVTDAGSSRTEVRSYIIGTGSVRSVPPEYTSPAGESSDVLVTGDYEGEIRLIPKLATSSFDIGILSVSDFVELLVEPQGTARDHFTSSSMTQSESVRIVTG